MALEAHQYQWTVNGELSVTTETIDGAEFNKSDTLSCAITPTDGAHDGEPLSSAELQVQNTPPNITGVTIDPAGGTEESVFTCVPSGWADPDPGDEAPVDNETGNEEAGNEEAKEENENSIKAEALAGA